MTKGLGKEKQVMKQMETITTTWKPCPLSGAAACPGILMPFEDSVVCSEILAWEHRDFEEGGESG